MSAVYDWANDLDYLNSDLCPLVNPLCPPDLCILPGGHKGHHQLGTSAGPERLSNVMFLYDGPRPFTKRDLIRAGVERREELFPGYWD